MDEKQLIEVVQQNKDEFDFREIDENHQSFDSNNKKVFGKMKI